MSASPRFAPMPLAVLKEPFDHDDFIFELKYDGFRALVHVDSGPLGAPADTYSVFLKRHDGVVDQRAITKFSNQLGFPVNVSQVPNRTLIDVNMHFPEGREPYGPTREAVENAANATFGSDPNVQDIGTFGRNYDSNYVPQTDYEGKINAWRQQATADYAARTAQTNKPGRARPPWNPEERTGNLARVREKIRAVAQARDQKFAEWTQATRARLERQRLATPSIPPKAPGMAEGGLATSIPGNPQARGRHGIHDVFRALRRHRLSPAITYIFQGMIALCSYGARCFT